VLQRAISIIFAHKLLILLPLIIVLPITTAVGFRPKQKHWQSTAVVWVDEPQPDYGKEDLGWTPAGNQAVFLNQLMHTTSFSTEVLQQTSLAGRLKDPKSKDQALKDFWTSAWVAPSQVNFMTIGVTMTDPTLAFTTAKAILASYQSHLTTRGETESDAAISQASDDLKQAGQALANANSQLATYLSAHPELTQTDKAGTLATSRDPNFALFSQSVTDAQAAYTAQRQHLLDLEQTSSTGRQAQAFQFNVIDEPEMPQLPIQDRLLDKIQIPAIGLLLALMLSACIAAVLIIADHSVVNGLDVLVELNLPLLAEIPELRCDSGPYGDSDDCVRLTLSDPRSFSPLSAQR
jgi:hypothetical protein